MAITAEDFQAVLTTLSQLLPMQRQLDAAALVMAWDTWPRAAKQLLTTEMLQFAAMQRQMDPAPPREVALHMNLLRYLFPVENDRPMVERGLRPDLAERMAAPDQFHDPAPRREERQAPRPRLGSGFWHPRQMTEGQRRAHVERVAADARQLIAGGVAGQGMPVAAILQGRRWFMQALAGFWHLKADEAGIAAAWITRNANEAELLIQAALDGELQAAGAEAVVAEVLDGEVASW